MQVRIDASRCQGHGRCYDLAPQHFTEDDEGYGQVVGTGEFDDRELDIVNIAVLNCPEAAIEVTS